MINCSVKEHLVPSLLSSPICYVSATRTVKEASLQKLQRRRKVLKNMMGHSNKFTGKTFQAAQQTHEIFLTLDHSCKIFFDICPTEQVDKIWAHF